MDKGTLACMTLGGLAGAGMALAGFGPILFLSATGTTCMVAVLAAGWWRR